MRSPLDKKAYREKRCVKIFNYWMRFQILYFDFAAYAAPLRHLYAAYGPADEYLIMKKY